MGQVRGDAGVGEAQRAHRIAQAGFAGLSVTLCDLPPYGRIAAEAGAGGYWFAYRPDAEKGDAWLTIPPLGLAHRRVSRENFALLQPRVPLPGEWANASGRVAQFVFSPAFIEAIASDIGLSSQVLQRVSHFPFSADRQIDALCRLLIEETEHGCPRGAIYFESIACALAIDMLSQVRDQDTAGLHSLAIPPQVGQAIKRLEGQYADHLSLAELADEAGMSQRHFARVFRRVTGCAPHQYLVRVRVSRARVLMAHSGRKATLAEIAAACGFSDQAHLGRHFRRAFGTTPAAYLRWQQSSKRWPECSIPP